MEGVEGEYEGGEGRVGEGKGKGKERERIRGEKEIGGGMGK